MPSDSHLDGINGWLRVRTLRVGWNASEQAKANKEPNHQAGGMKNETPPRFWGSRADVHI